MALLVAVFLGAALLAGCTDRDTSARPVPPSSAGPSSAGASPTPRLGGRTPTRHAVPREAMDDLERPVQRRLAEQVRGQGLSLDYLACPRWDGAVPARMTCTGYVDGLVAPVDVRLEAAVRGRAVDFDARLLDGVIATRRLTDLLRSQGWSGADCGEVAAYPARVGSRIVCRVVRGGEPRFVVATVQARSGRVMISGYPSS